MAVPPCIAPSQITGVVLAGGLGTRMGGVDKGLEMLNGICLAQHVLRRLQLQAGPCCISANRHLEEYTRFGVPVLPDTVPDFAGPLAGVLAALQYCETPYLAAVPCDVPFFPDTLIARLSQALVDSGASAAVAVAMQADAAGAQDADGGGGGPVWRRQPTLCLVRSDLRTALEQFMAGGGRKAGAWLTAIGAVSVRFEDGVTAFANVNTAQQLQTLRS